LQARRLSHYRITLDHYLDKIIYQERCFLYTHAHYEEAVVAIRKFTDAKPTIGLVLGSGLGGLADMLEDRVVIPYSAIPHFPTSTVHGHSGELIIGKLGGKVVAVQKGRAHFYEGYNLQQVTFPIRVMHFLGIQTVILTNAAGGLNTSFKAGDVMMLNDHINLVGFVGLSPLAGPNDDELGPRFVGLVQTYDRTLRQLTHEVAKSNNIPLQEGVYCCLGGPTYETPAEARMLRMVGGDAVGMSTVHEVVVARHMGMKVLAFSSITNMVIDNLNTDYETNHEEVLEVGRIIVPKLIAILKGVVERL